MNNITILGSGTWGTALANLLAAKGKKVILYTRFKEEAEYFSKFRIHRNLPNAKINEAIVYSYNMEEALKDAEAVVFASPSPYVRSTAENVKPFFRKEVIYITVAKGIEKGSHLTMSEILKEVLGKDAKVACLSGPTHAEEVSLLLPTAIISSSEDKEVALKVQELFATSFMRVYLNPDIKGVELSGALKNIIALSGGISDGLGYGDNAKAALITRGLAEITRLGVKMGCRKETFFGLSGIGDIVVTATSTHSRNHNAGKLLGQGKKLKEVLDEIGMVVEGINALDAAKELSIEYGVEMPIVDAVYDIVKNGKPPVEAVGELFSRQFKSEI